MSSALLCHSLLGTLSSCPSLQHKVVPASEATEVRAALRKHEGSLDQLAALQPTQLVQPDLAKSSMGKVSPPPSAAAQGSILELCPMQLLLLLCPLLLLLLLRPLLLLLRPLLLLLRPLLLLLPPLLLLPL